MPCMIVHTWITVAGPPGSSPRDRDLARSLVEQPGVTTAAGLSDALGDLLSIHRHARFEDRYGLRVSFTQALMMSLLFLAMLYSRRSLRGQSLAIGICKMLGMMFASLGVWLRPPLPEYADSTMLHYMYITTFVTDLVYVVAVYSIRSTRMPSLVRPPDDGDPRVAPPPARVADPDTAAPAGSR